MKNNTIIFLKECQKCYGVNGPPYYCQSHTAEGLKLTRTNQCLLTNFHDSFVSFRSVNTTMVKLTNTISFNGPVLKHHTFHFTLKMTYPLFVETSVLNNRSFQNYLTWMIRIYKLLILLGSDHLPRNKFYLIVRCTNIAAMTLCGSKLSAIMC